MPLTPCTQRPARNHALSRDEPSHVGGTALIIRSAGLLASLLVLSSVASSLDPENDAGSGGDAGNTRATALPVADGAYHGNLSGGRDSDWYALEAFSSGRCVEVEASGGAWADLVLSTPVAEVARPIREGASARLGVAEVSASRPLVGLLPTRNPAENDPTRPGPYAFAVARLAHADLGPGDGGTGVDAPSSGGAAMKRPCVAGRLDRILGDHADAYTISGVAGTRMTLSFVRLVDGPATLTLVAPSGLEVAELHGGDAATVTLAENGVYSLVVDDGGASALGTETAVPLSIARVPYIFAATEDPGRGCRPTCVE